MLWRISALDKSYLQLSLFDWADSQERKHHQGYPASHLQRHYRLNPVQARLVSELAFQGGRL